MSWTIYEKTREKRSTQPLLTISKKYGRFSFNSSAAEIMKKNAMENVLLMWNPEDRQIGVRNVMKKDTRAFAVRFAKKQNGAAFGARSFLNHIGYDYTETHSFPCNWDDGEGIFVIQLSEDVLGNRTSQRVAKMPASRGRGPEVGNVKTQAIG